MKENHDDKIKTKKEKKLKKTTNSIDNVNEDTNKINKPKEEKKQVEKQKIIPSYQKSKEPGNKKEKKKLDKKVIKSRITIVILVALVILVGLAIFGIVSLVKYNKYKPYFGLEETMKNYGFDKVYDNQSAKTGESITKSEAVKMVLATVFNTNDISGFAGEPEENYNNAMWVEYAKYRGIIGEADVTKDNADEKATYIEVIRYFVNAKTKILEKEVNSAIDLKVKDIDKYKPDEKIAIEDMIANEIITINKKKINGDSKIFKGQMNEIISNFLVKYNTITIEDAKVNINEDKMPSNKDQYPYTLSDVDKSVYEKEDYIYDKNSYENAKSVYSEKKEFYFQISNYVEQYFNTILNVDYTTINTDKFAADILPYMLYGVDKEKVKEYVQYVKDNKIVLKGNAKVALPAVYYDGRNYRVRTIVEVDFSGCYTDKNLFFGDNLELETQYDTNTSKMILDVPMGESMDEDLNLSISNGSIKNWIAGSIKLEF